MFNDDDFFLDDDELAEDNQINLIDSAKINVLNSLIKSANDMLENIRFNEKSEAGHNVQIIASYVDNLIELDQLEEEGLSDEEIFEYIDNILKKTTELTFGNIKEILPDEESEAKTFVDDSDSGESTDW